MSNRDAGTEENRLAIVTDDELWGEVEPWLFAASYEVLARRVLDIGYAEDATQADVVDLRSFVVEDLGHEENKVPEHPTHFFQFVVRWLGLERLPSERLLNIYEEASRDLQDIQTNIEQFAKSVEEIKQKQNPSGRENYDKQFYQAMIERNRKAEQDVLDFLRGDLRERAIWEATEQPFGWLPLRPRYWFNEQPGWYSMRLSEVRNKFSLEPLPFIRKMERLHRDDGDAFYAELDRYFEVEKSEGEVIEGVDTHHLLNQRESVLRRAIEFFGEGDWITFCNLVPLQIEGIFTDYCAELDIVYPTMGLSTKLDALREQYEADTFIYFDYYRYRFPVRRNRVAHGGFYAGDHEHTAKMLLLDLRDVCRHVREDPLPINQLLDAARRLPGPNFRVLKFCTFFASNLIIPKFYNDELFDCLHDARDRLSNDHFWDWLDALADKLGDADNRRLSSVVVQIKQKGIRVDRCESRLRDSHGHANEQLGWRDLWDFVHLLEEREAAA